MYQIFTDRFYNGDNTNDVIDGEYTYIEQKVKAVSWDQPVQNPDYNVFTWWRHSRNNR